MEDEALWKRRFHLFALVRLTGVALFLLGIAIAYSNLLRPGGWPVLGAIIGIIGAMDAVIAPRILKRSWTKK
ncbi:MAG: hypothetical protein ABIN83_03140 [Sphingomicrobium sp.]